MALSDKALESLEVGMASTDLAAEVASAADASAGKFSGQVTGMTSDVSIRADKAGTAGNVTLTANSSDDIDTLIDAHNASNPDDTITLESGDGSQVPTTGNDIVLAGGAGDGSLSDKAQASLKIGMAQDELGDEVIEAIEAGSKAISSKARAATKIMMASNDHGDEFSDLIEA